MLNPMMEKLKGLLKRIDKLIWTEWTESKLKYAEDVLKKMFGIKDDEA